MARLLLDEQMPRRLAAYLPGHDVRTVQGMGWTSLKNGALLNASERDFDLLLTVDYGIRFQQSVVGRQIAVVVIRTYRSRLQDLVPFIELIAAAIEAAQPGTVTEIDLKPLQR
jgi:predicted nuclease of predicted toxin-antitoxin system